MYKAHLFVCTNSPDKPGKCGHLNADKLFQETKELSREQGWGKTVRISKSGCLGQCEHGIACVIYPQNQWLLEKGKNDAKDLIDAVKKLL